MRAEVRVFKTIHELLDTNAQFLYFHEGRSAEPPEFYHRRSEKRLGKYAVLMPRDERRPVLGASPKRDDISLALSE